MTAANRRGSLVVVRGLATDKARVHRIPDPRGHGVRTPCGLQTVEQALVYARLGNLAGNVAVCGRCFPDVKP